MVHYLYQGMWITQFRAAASTATTKTAGQTVAVRKIDCNVAVNVIKMGSKHKGEDSHKRTICSPLHPLLLL